MAVFHYKAKNKNAETIVGQVEANTKEEAVEKVSRFGLVPVSVEAESAGKARMIQTEAVKKSAPLVRPGTGSRSGHGRKRITLKQLFLFSRQFASLLKSGISILRALEVLAKQTTNEYFKNALSEIGSGIQGGRSLSESLVQYPGIFPPIYISMCRAGEESGKLPDVIADAAEYLKSQMDIRNKIRTALVYPLMMLLFGTGAVVFILTTVMPKITKIFIDTNQALPAPTKIVMQISNVLVHHWGWILFFLAVFVVIVRQWARTEAGARFVCDVQLKMPILGEMWLKEDLARFSRTMTLLLESGVSIVTAMKLSIPTVSNVFLREQFDHCREELVAGRSLGEQIKQMSLIPDVMGDLVAVGEEAGSLAPSFKDIAENYEQEINDYVKVMTTLFEPLMIVVVGALIGFIVIAMLLPIFQMDLFS